jgi:hypothetical protein
VEVKYESEKDVDAVCCNCICTSGVSAYSAANCLAYLATAHTYTAANGNGYIYAHAHRYAHRYPHHHTYAAAADQNTHPDTHHNRAGFAYHDTGAAYHNTSLAYRDARRAPLARDGRVT